MCVQKMASLPAGAICLFAFAACQPQGKHGKVDEFKSKLTCLSLGIRTSFSKEICLQCTQGSPHVESVLPLANDLMIWIGLTHWQPRCFSLWQGLLYNIANLQELPSQNHTPSRKWISRDAHHWCTTLPFIIWCFYRIRSHYIRYNIRKQQG